MVNTTRRLPLCIAFAGLLVAGMAARAFGSYSATDTPPRSGTFTLHGQPVDTLSDGHMLMQFRAPYAIRAAASRMALTGPLTSGRTMSPSWGSNQRRHRRQILWCLVSGTPSTGMTVLQDRVSVPATTGIRARSVLGAQCTHFRFEWKQNEDCRGKGREAE